MYHDQFDLDLDNRLLEGIREYPWAIDGMRVRVVRAYVELGPYIVGDIWEVVQSYHRLNVKKDGEIRAGFDTVWAPAEEFNEKSVEEML